MSIPSFSLEGQVAIVTGGGAGIGQGIVHCLAEEGADVAVIDINGDNAKKVADEVKALGRKSLAIEADLTDSKQVHQAVQETIDTLGKIDILVNNVGGLSETSLARTSLQFVDVGEAEWGETFELNLKTHVLMCQAVVPHFQKQKSGKIVNISSTAGKIPHPWLMVYAAAKAADISLTRSLAMELGGDNINVNCICPGIIYTPLWEKIAAQRIRLLPDAEAKGMEPREYFLRMVPRVPLKREQTAEDIGHAVAFLVSEDAKNITGQSLNINGGSRMD